MSSDREYDELLGKLFPRLTGGIHWGLERTERLLLAAGKPHLRFETVHIAGTNGKGSVAAAIAAALEDAGLRTGLYTSPHLCTFRERIQVGGEPVSKAALVAAARELWPRIEAEDASFFEATTAVAFRLLADAAVDVAVVEVGLGGRLDATNVVRPALTVLTNVGLDHAEYLGHAIEDIAREKAGIFKQGIPAVTAAGGAALDVITAAAADAGAPLTVVDEHSFDLLESGAAGNRLAVKDVAGTIDVWTPLAGEHQAWNAAVAATALRRLPERLRPDDAAIVSGLGRVSWGGRMQQENIAGVQWVFDVAHNPEGVAALARAAELLSLPRPRTAVVGILGDKDWAQMLSALAGAVDALIVTLPPTAPSGRRWDPAEALRGANVDGMVERDFTRALERAQLLSRPDGTVIVTGSFHTVGDALISLQRTPFGADVALPQPAFSV